MFPASSLPALVAGLGLGLSLIVAIGAQNAFVLRQGLRGEHVGPVVAICVGSDALLILAGVGGAGAVLSRLPGLATWMRLAGAAFLLGYGLLAARRAVRPTALQLDAAGTRRGLAAVLATCVALTWLNPHVYLDTVVLLGTYASAWEERRWWFAAGAVVGSTVWFTALGYGARWLRPVFTRPGAWRVLDALIAAIMITLAVLLAVQA